MYIISDNYFDYYEHPSYFGFETNRQNFRSSTELLVETVGKGFPCLCGRNYSHKNNLNYHMRWECGGKLICKKCERIFKGLNDYRKHVRRCSGNT